jgi:hypothetical protein
MRNYVAYFIDRAHTSGAKECQYLVITETFARFKDCA